MPDIPSDPPWPPVVAALPDVRSLPQPEIASVAASDSPTPTTLDDMKVRQDAFTGIRFVDMFVNARSKNETVLRPRAGDVPMGVTILGRNVLIPASPAR
jgi:hypothetical protein